MAAFDVPPARTPLDGYRRFGSDVHTGINAVRVASMVTGQASGFAITRVYGVPKEDQTVLIKVLLVGSAATVVAGIVGELPVIRPTARGLIAGGGVLNVGIRTLGGPPSGTMPAFGALVGCALTAAVARAVLVRSWHDAAAMAHAVAHRYGSHAPAP
jgi:hypothetical protein